MNGIKKVKDEKKKIAYMKDGEKIVPAYEMLFEKYLLEDRDHNVDFTTFAEHLKETRPSLSAKQTITAVRTLLASFDIKVSDETSRTIKRESMKGNAATAKKTITQKVIADALQHMTVQGRAVILSLASSGARLNEILNIAINDVDFDHNPVKITIRESKNGDQRTSFISDEAAQYVKEFLKVRSDYIEMSNAKSKKLIAKHNIQEKSDNDPRLFPFSSFAVTNWWTDALSDSGKLSIDHVTKRNQMSIHGLRAFFISQMSLIVSKEVPETLAGHAGYLTGSYRTYSDEQLAAEYLKAMHVVSIFGSKQIKELENELKSAQQVSAEKISKHSDTLLTVIQENIELKKELNEIKKTLATVQDFMENGYIQLQDGQKLYINPSKNSF